MSALYLVVDDCKGAVGLLSVWGLLAVPTPWEAVC
jgi:hypothetical protein